MGGRVLDSEAIAFVSDRLAMVLVNHLDVIEDLSARLDAAEVTGRYSTPEIRRGLESLRALRSRVLEDLRLFSESDYDAGIDSLRDLHALVSYYIEVAYKHEKKALEQALAGRLDVARDIRELEEAYRLAVAVRERLQSIIRGIDPTWLS